MDDRGTSMLLVDADMPITAAEGHGLALRDQSQQTHRDELGIVYGAIEGVNTDDEKPANSTVKAADTALDLGLLHVAKLPLLPIELREIVENLTPEGLANLLAVVSKHDWFDFLGLPLEVRGIVYEQAFSTSNQTIVRRTRRHNLLWSINLLLTSKTVYDEAYPVFTRVNQAHFVIGRGEEVAIPQPIANRAFENFMRLTFTIPATWHVRQLDSPGCKSWHAAARLSQVVNMIHSACESRPAHRSLSVHIEFDVLSSAAMHAFFQNPKLGILHRDQILLDRPRRGRHAFGGYTGHIITAMAAYIRNQLSLLMSATRNKLDQDLNVTMTSNVDNELPGVVVHRLQEWKAKIRLLAERKQIRIEVWHENDTPHWFVEEWTDAQPF